MKSRNPKDLRKKYLEKIKLIKKYNEAYYNLSKPIVDDATYDNIKKEINEIEKKYPTEIHYDSPSFVVGYKPSKMHLIETI